MELYLQQLEQVVNCIQCAYVAGSSELSRVHLRRALVLLEEFSVQLRSLISNFERMSEEAQETPRHVDTLNIATVIADNHRF